MLRVLRGVARIVFFVVVLAAVGIGAFVGITLAHFGRDLPDHQQLTKYVPAIGSKVYAGDGTLMTEFETEHRIPVTIAKVPKLVIQAFLAAEDRDFYKHNGVDPAAIFRAAMADVLRFQKGQRPIGASTITQQVVRHFLLTKEVSVSRKVKEAILAYRIEHTLSKDRILEIYLNEIYFGAGAYGVAAAADTYFQKTLDQLTLAEVGLSRGPAEGAQQLQPDPPCGGGQGTARLGHRRHGRSRLGQRDAGQDRDRRAARRRSLTPSGSAIAACACARRSPSRPCRRAPSRAAPWPPARGGSGGSCWAPSAMPRDRRFAPATTGRAAFGNRCPRRRRPHTCRRPDRFR